MREHTFMPYWSLAITGLSEMNVKSLRRQVNGSGTMRAQKMSISVTKRRKTWKRTKVSTWITLCVRRGVVERTRERRAINDVPLERVPIAPAARRKIL